MKSIPEDIVNKIFQGDCIEGMRTLPDQSVNCCVTSPPYYGLRDYGNDGQIGLEETPEAFVAKLVEVFREVKRVLKDDGTIWVNLGDSYWGGGWRGAAFNEKSGNIQKGSKGTYCGESLKLIGTGKSDTYKSKDLIGIPWMVAFALRADGWYLRQDIIWHKPNPMPESVTDRCTKSHEYIFLLSKSQKYYYDHDAIMQEFTSEPKPRKDSTTTRAYQNTAAKTGTDFADDMRVTYGANGANKRSVWTVTTKPYSEAHFATYPPDLIVDCIKAGCPEGGLILDPFMGAGTTAMVARKLNRNYVGFELNPEYIKIAQNRIHAELGMFS